MFIEVKSDYIKNVKNFFKNDIFKKDLKYYLGYVYLV